MINYYKLEITGKNTYRFFNKIITSNINIFDVKHTHNKLYLKASYEDYKKILKINTIYEIKIIEVKGINRIKSLFRFYKLFLLFFILFLFLIYIYSNMIFFIEINGNNEKLKSEIYNNLNKYDIQIYSFKKSYKKLDNIANKIKNDYKNNIEWIEIKKHGVRYEIDFIEKINYENKNNDSKTNVVASKNGLIMDIYSNKGEILKFKGDYVNKGDIIVSGIIKKNDDIKNIVNANAKVYAEVWYKVNIEHPLTLYEQKNTIGNKSLILKIFNQNIYLFNIKSNIKKESNKTLINNSIFNLKYEKKYIKNLVKRKYQEKELINKLENMAKESINKNLKNNEKILLQKTLKTSTYNGKMYIEVFFKVYEDIATIQNIVLNE